jgi:CRISPR-associated endonuclease/helicase Cas3
MKFYSHPDKLILTHLMEVNEISRNYCDKKYSKAEEILSFSHDFGKYTTFFQKYILGKDKTKNALNNHGFISALFGAFIALDFYNDDIMSVIIYNCILHHHGSIQNVDINLPKNFRRPVIYESNLRGKVDDTYEQIEDIEKNSKFIAEDYKKIGYEKYFDEFIIQKPLEKILTKLKRIQSKFEYDNESGETYFISQMLYSSLIAADKISASNTDLPEIKFADFDILNETKNKKFKDSAGDKINLIRAQIFNSVQNQIENVYKENRVFSITAPTGTGKTYCGFFAALKLQKLLGENRKIIYSLPFTSIINQNYSSIYSLFENISDFKNESSEYIIKHHSLADVEYSSEYENYTKVKAEMLIENWNSGIIITTFVQLLETLIGNKNRMLKKFNALKNSIVILDEVQAIDIKYLKLVEFILESASRYLDCRIIMMTATRPLILSNAAELLENNKKYFDMFNRTSIISRLEPIKIENFIEEFYDNMENKSYLIICNTIAQSLKIYKELKNSGRKVLYLSTNILPCHRKERIDKVTQMLKKGEKTILVSTQVVEAGVDFDFDVVIRDIAPIDAIIQSAGRCNRNGKRKNGNVYVYSMVDDSGTYYGTRVYGKTLISISRELLQDRECIEEKEYFELIGDYFNEVNENKNQEDSEKFKESIIKMYFNDKDYSLDKFSLIKENSNYVDVFFRINDEAERIYNELLKALSIKNIEAKSEKMLEIKNKVREYTLSIPDKYVNRVNNKDDIILNFPKSACEVYYDDMTGYKREKEEDFFVM